MPLFDLKTSKSKERDGVPLDFTDYRVTIRRSGGANASFEQEYTKQTKQYRRVIALGKLPEAKDKEITYKVYATSVVKLWETCLQTLPEQAQTPELVKEAEGNQGFVKGIDWDGVLIPSNPENIAKLFHEIGDVFLEIREASSGSDLFLEDQRLKDSKN